jgi:hypothetical protein
VNSLPFGNFTPFSSGLGSAATLVRANKVTRNGAEHQVVATGTAVKVFLYHTGIGSGFIGSSDLVGQSL